MFEVSGDDGLFTPDVCEDCENAVLERTSGQIWDFEVFSTITDPVEEMKIKSLVGKVRIRRKAIDKERIYDAGNMTTFPAEFLKDLTNGFFD